jgi:hypothetical protein
VPVNIGKSIKIRQRERLRFTGGASPLVPGKKLHFYATKVNDSDLDTIVGLSQDITFIQSSILRDHSIDYRISLSLKTI